MPVGYFLIDALGGTERKALVERCITLMHSCGMDIVCLTFDGAASNIAMAKNLGCTLSVRNLSPCFKHPVTGDKINVFYDACHMLKLIRNTFADWRYIKDGENNGIKYSLIEKLHELQQSTGLHLANKLRKAHINFYNKKINIKLAAQIFRNSIATALEFCEMNKVPGFESAAPTVRFIRTINRVFDVLNSRSLLSYDFKKPISSENSSTIFDHLDADFDYIPNLCCPNSSKLVTDTNRKTVFTGFLIDILSVKSWYLMISKFDMKYLLMYKVSQDHLELFFGKIRSHGGWNNNPTVVQFIAAYKRLIIHNISEVLRGNCISLQSMSILNVTSKISKPKSKTSSIMLREINNSNGRCSLVDGLEVDDVDNDTIIDVESNMTFNEAFHQNIISYIGGCIVRKINQYLKCLDCREALLEKVHRNFLPSMQFIALKDKGGLTYPSKDVINICLSAERVFKANVHKDSSQ